MKESIAQMNRFTSRLSQWLAEAMDQQIAKALLEIGIDINSGLNNLTEIIRKENIQIQRTAPTLYSASHGTQNVVEKVALTRNGAPWKRWKVIQEEKDGQLSYEIKEVG